MEDSVKEDKEEDSGGLMWLGIGIGIIIGGIIVALFLKSRQTSNPASTTYSMSFPDTPQPGVLYMIQPVGVANQNMMQSHEPYGASAYKNKEQWEIERGEGGLINRISVLRDVKMDMDASEE